jgi:hypothetical protein
VILEDRKTVLMTLCMLGKSSVVTELREDAVEDEADEDDEDDEVVEEGRAGFRAYVPRLILVRG